MNNAAKNLMLEALKAVATKASLHIANGDEVSGGTYARQTITWGDASDGEVSDSSVPEFAIPAGTVVATVKVWNAAGTIEYVSHDATDETFANAGTYTITDLTLNLNK